MPTPRSERPVALVSGSGSGIGAATALRLAQLGCDLVLTYSRNAAGAEETARACRAHGVDVLIIAADVAEHEECRSAVAAAAERHARLDVLVNNAGTTKFVSA